MDLKEGSIGIVSDLDPVNKKVRVKWPTDNVTSAWLQVISMSGFYYMPQINDQVLCLYDEEWNKGVVLGKLTKDGEAEYDSSNIIGFKLGNVEFKINKSSGAVEVTTDQQVTVKANKVLLDAGNIEISGDLDVKGESKFAGKLSANQNIEAVGTIKSDTDVQTPTVKLITHLHTSAAPGSPTSPPVPGT